MSHLELKTEVVNESNINSPAFSSANAFINEVSDSLKAMPAAALKQARLGEAAEYVQQNMTSLDKSGNGFIDMKELQMAKQRAADPCEKAKIDNVITNYDQIKGAVKIEFGTGISRKDADEISFEAKIYAEARTIVKALFEGPKPLYTALDKNPNSRRNPGIDQNELLSFLNTYESQKRSGNVNNDSIYSDKNGQIVTNILAHWNDKNSAVSRLTRRDWAIDPCVIGSALDMKFENRNHQDRSEVLIKRAAKGEI